MTTALPASSSRRPLALTWLGVAVPTACVAILLLGLSEHTDARAAGWILVGLTLSALALGGWLLGPGRDAGPVLSLALSAVWAVAALALYPTQDFVTDALWVCGVPLLSAVLTAAVALRSRGGDQL